MCVWLLSVVFVCSCYPVCAVPSSAHTILGGCVCVCVREMTVVCVCITLSAVGLMGEVWVLSHGHVCV